MAARSAVMVGRDAELSLLLETLDRARSGDAQVVLVRGEAGIGKTRLVRELVARVKDDTVVAFGHAVPLSGGALPYGVVADLLRALVREVGDDLVTQVLGERTRVLAPLVPRLGADASNPVDRPALFAATQDLLSDLATERTLMLVVEDLHWCDGSSMDLLVFWARTIVRGRVMLVVTARDTGVDDDVRLQVGELGRLPDATSADLAPLGAAEVSRQARSLDSTLGDLRLAEIERLSEGIPLYVEELVAGGLGPVSDALRVNLLARLRSLEAEDERLLHLAALAARRVDPSRLAEVAEVSTSQVEAALDRAVIAGLLAADDDGYAFRHELLRVAAAESSPPSLRREGHRRWADVLGTDTSDMGDLVAAADHWAALGPSRESFLARLAAADAVWGVSGSREAADQWMRALRMIHEDQTVATEEEHDQALGAVTALQEVRGPDYGEILAVEESVTGPEPSIRRDFLDLSAHIDDMYAHGWGEPESVLEQVARHRRRLERHPPTLLLFEASLLLLRACWFVERYDQEFERCLDVVERSVPDLPDRQTNATSLQIVWRAMTREVRKNDAVCAAYYREAVQRTTSLDSRSRCRILDRASVVSLRQGDLATVLQLSDEARRLVRGPDVDGLWNTAALSAAHAHAALGAWSEAEQEASQVWGGSRWARQRLEAFWVRSQVLLDQGRNEEVVALVDEVIAWGPAPSATFRPEGYLDAVRAAMVLDHHPATAQELLARHLGTDLGVFDHADGGPFGRAWSLAAELTWHNPPPPGYVDDLRTALELSLTRDPLGRTWMTEVEAQLARGSGGETAERWKHAIQAWDQMEVPFAAARCRLRLAELLLGGDDRDGARELLATALTAAESLGARPLAQATRELARRARLPLPGLEPDENRGAAGLTARELEVLRLLAGGMTNEQIGTALFISPRTASVHVSRILQKLGASNRTEVAAMAHRSGLLAEG